MANKCMSCGHQYSLGSPSCPKCGSRESIGGASSLEEIDALFGGQDAQRESAEHSHKGGEFFMKGDFKKARIEFEAAIKADPNSANGQENLGATLCKLGLYLEAIPHLERALQIQPSKRHAKEFLAEARSLFGGKPAAAASSASDARYSNTEWNFSLPMPREWEVIFENSIQAFPWTKPVCLAGPEGARGRPYITVVTQLVEDNGMGLSGYMAKAESDLRKAFNNFRLLTKSEQTLLGWPSAWMTYTYRGDSGPRKELNVTTFFGKGRMMWFQCLCETAENQAPHDFPVFERIIKGLRVGSAGIRHPQVILSGATSCGLCGKSFSSGSKPNAMVSLKLGRLIGVCDSCRDAY